MFRIFTFQVGNWTINYGFLQNDETIFFHGNRTKVINYVSDLGTRTLRIVCNDYAPFTMFGDNITDRSFMRNGDIYGKMTYV